jgi:hypothetical protein
MEAHGSLTKDQHALSKSSRIVSSTIFRVSDNEINIGNTGEKYSMVIPLDDHQ